MKSFEFKDFEEENNPQRPAILSTKKSYNKSKIVICRDWTASGVCERGDVCRFAHGSADPRLDSLFKSNNWKSRSSNENRGSNSNGRNPSIQNVGGISDQFQQMSLQSQSQRGYESPPAQTPPRKILFLQKKSGNHVATRENTIDRDGGNKMSWRGSSPAGSEQSKQDRGERKLFGTPNRGGSSSWKKQQQSTPRKAAYTP
jgi:hypothetical protein